MKKYRDIIINIFEEYLKLRIKKNDKKSMGRHKGRPKRSSKKS